MAFINTDNSIVIDKKSNIYNFKLTVEGIEVVMHEKSTGDSRKSKVVDERVLEYDVCINKDDEIDIICKKRDSSLSIYTLKNEEWIESNILNEIDGDICGVKIIAVNESKHIFYYMQSPRDNSRLIIYHHYIKDGKWHTNLVKEIYKDEIIKPMEIIKNKESITITYYDLSENSEDIFIQKFDIKNNEWKNPTNITNDGKIKLYLDILQMNEQLHVVYSEYEDENLSIKYKKFKTSLNEIELISEHILSNQTNCTYPTIIYAGDILWTTWTEYESVVSSYSNDRGNSWSNPYVWNESKKGDFIRSKFNTTDKELRKTYKMNYSFSKTYPELYFLGFGNLSQATEVIKKKKNMKMN